MLEQMTHTVKKMYAAKHVINSRSKSEVRPTAHVERDEVEQWVDSQHLAVVDDILAVVLAVVRIGRVIVDRMGVGHSDMVAAGEAPHPLRARSKTYHPKKFTCRDQWQK